MNSVTLHQKAWNAADYALRGLVQTRAEDITELADRIYQLCEQTRQDISKTRKR